jgi:hypothetical protein
MLEPRPLTPRRLLLVLLEVGATQLLPVLADDAFLGAVPLPALARLAQPPPFLDTARASRLE